MEEPFQYGDIRLRAVLDTAVDGIILVDARGRVQIFNPACERLFGYAAAEVVGRNVAMLMPEPYHSEHDRYIENYQRTGKAKIIGIGREVVGRRKDGSMFPMHLSVGHARQGDEVFYVGIVSDLSDSKRVHEQLRQAQKMEAIGQLTGGIAHDFNNLLTVIVTNLDFLADGGVDEAGRAELIEGAIKAAMGGADLTRRLLAFARQQPLQPQVVDLNERLPGLAALLQRSLGESIRLTIAPERGLWPTRADPTCIEDALLNLAINARDAMPSGGELSIETANVRLDEGYAAQNSEVAPGDYVMLAVSDSGCGMTRETVERAYEPFFTTKKHGTGLGLAMIYGFAKQSGGHLKIYSEVGHGTTVRLYLPRELSVAPAEPSQPVATAGPLARGSEMILVVEDNAQIRAAVLRQLSELGYRARSAEHAHAALALIRGGLACDLLFTDIVMPEGMSGFDLARSVRQLRPQMRVLFTTGFAKAKQTGEGGGMSPGDLVLRKPYRREELARMVRAALGPPG